MANNYTIKEIKEIIADEIKFETLEVTEITKIADVLANTKVQGADKLMARFLKLIKERKDIAPKEEVAELVTIENSVKVQKPIKKKITPNVGAQKVAEQKAEEVQAELPLEEKEEEVKPLEEHTIAELQGILTGLGIPFAKNAKKVKLISLIQDNVTGKKEESKPEKEEEVVSIFPDTDALGNVRIDFKNLPKAVQSHPYKVVAYVQEQGAVEFSQFTVIFANSEITVLLDSVIVKNSVIPCDVSHFSNNGTILSLEDNLCPVAFYAPSK